MAVLLITHCGCGRGNYHYEKLKCWVQTASSHGAAGQRDMCDCHGNGNDFISLNENE